MPDADCDCHKALHRGGCYIDCQRAPPPGYRCKCSYSTCSGTPQICNSYNDIGCSGCSDRECCTKSCRGYLDIIEDKEDKSTTDQDITEDGDEVDDGDESE